MLIVTTPKISSVKLRRSTATRNNKIDTIRKYKVTSRCAVISVARSYHLVKCNHRTFCYCKVLCHVTTRTKLYLFVLCHVTTRTELYLFVLCHVTTRAELYLFV